MTASAVVHLAVDVDRRRIAIENADQCVAEWLGEPGVSAVAAQGEHLPFAQGDAGWYNSLLAFVLLILL